MHEPTDNLAPTSADGGHRQLVVMRHAKAEQAGRTDYERALSARGNADAAAAGDWLARAGLTPQAALVSAAERTRATWQSVAQAAAWAVKPDFDRALYAAGPESALDLIRGTAEVVATLIVVGHNPTIATLAHLLDSGEGDPAAGGEMSQGFPTCALAVFEFDGAWADLDWAMARITGFHVGRA